jgi:hypothetical protein
MTNLVNRHSQFLERRIREAFAHRTYPSAPLQPEMPKFTSVIETEGDDARLAKYFFGKKRWDEITVEELVIPYRYGWDEYLHFVDHERLLYYLPTYMLALLNWSPEDQRITKVIEGVFYKLDEHAVRSFPPNGTPLLNDFCVGEIIAVLDFMRCMRSRYTFHQHWYKRIIRRYNARLNQIRES